MRVAQSEWSLVDNTCMHNMDPCTVCAMAATGIWDSKILCDQTVPMRLVQATKLYHPLIKF